MVRLGRWTAQMYRGLDIATAKAPEAERAGVPHQLLSVLAPWEEVTVREYRSMACEAISRRRACAPLPDGLPRAPTAGLLIPRHIRDIHARGKLPIVVGGTFYYVNALLWEAGVADTARVAEPDKGADDSTRGWTQELIRRPDPAPRGEREVHGRPSPVAAGESHLCLRVRDPHLTPSSGACTGDARGVGAGGPGAGRATPPPRSPPGVPVPPRPRGCPPRLTCTHSSPHVRSDTGWPRSWSRGCASRTSTACKLALWPASTADGAEGQSRRWVASPRTATPSGSAARKRHSTAGWTRGGCRPAPRPRASAPLLSQRAGRRGAAGWTA